LRLRFGRRLSLWDWVFGFNLLAGVVVANSVAPPAGGLYATFTFGPIAVVAHQRAYPASLAAYRIESVKAGDLHIEIRPSDLVEAL
jgi:hypothetical protein